MIRSFRIFFVIMITLFISLLAPRASLAVPHSPTIGETFVGESLIYDIGFWIFEKVAVSKLTLEKEKGGYKAVLSAHTVGFVDSMIQHRSDLYTAHLTEVEGGKRFATVSLASLSNVNGKVRHSIKELDRKAGVYKWHSWGGGKDDKSGTVSFKPGTYVDDPLGGFYNFRFGVYGKAGMGARFIINTFPKKDFKPEPITMKMGSALEAGYKKHKNNPGAAGGAIAYVAKVKMSKDVFGTDLANINIFFSPELIPLRARASDIVLFTDVTGILRKASKDK